MFIGPEGKTKSRTTRGPLLHIVEDYIDGNGVLHRDLDISLQTDGTQITESEGNRWPPPKGDLQDHGSEFFTQKREWVSPTVLPTTVIHAAKTVNYAEGTYVGPLIANCMNNHNIPAYTGVVDVPLKLNFPPDLSSSRTDLTVKGAIAVASCNPGNAIAQTATAVAELLQDVPHIPGIALWESRVRALATLGAAGDEFLNYIFGISPTIGDMGDFLKATHKIDKAVDQFIRDSGRVVRRSFYFPIEKTVSSDVLSNVYSPVGVARSTTPDHYAYNFLAQYAGNCLPAYETIRTRTTERKLWFSGAFTYYLPNWYDSGSERDRRRLMAELFGAKPDLNTLWNLAPWSWAVDWVSNAGAFVKNLNSLINYGTVLRYGYMMEETSTTDVYTAGNWVGNPTRSDLYPVFPVVSPVTLRTTTKKRIQANPFGFGLNWEGLSSVQKAIVAALGITRVAR